MSNIDLQKDIAELQTSIQGLVAERNRLQQDNLQLVNSLELECAKVTALRAALIRVIAVAEVEFGAAKQALYTSE